MIITIIIFFVAIIVAFGMLNYRAWKIRTLRVESPIIDPNREPVSFRHIEKIMLYLTKHILIWIVLSVVKLWFIITTKTKKWIVDKWPKIYHSLKRQPGHATENKNSFMSRAILESKIKIRRIKEKVRRDHGPIN